MCFRSSREHKHATILKRSSWKSFAGWVYRVIWDFEEQPKESVYSLRSLKHTHQFICKIFIVYIFDILKLLTSVYFVDFSYLKYTEWFIRNIVIIIIYY